MDAEFADQVEMRQHYNRYAEKYEVIFQDCGFSAPYHVARTLAGLLHDRAAPVLDFGAGTGMVGVTLRELGFSNVVGVDICESMLEIARGKGAYADLVHDGDETWLADKAECFDAVTSSGVFTGAIPIAASKLVALMECLRPGGYLLFNYRENDDSRQYAMQMGALIGSGVCTPSPGRHFQAFDEDAGLPEAENCQEVKVFRKL